MSLLNYCVGKKNFQSTPSDLTNLSTILQNLEQFDIKLTPDQFDKLKKSVDGSVSFKFFARNFSVQNFWVGFSKLWTEIGCFWVAFE